MTGKITSSKKINKILFLYAFGDINKTEISKAVHVSRGTVNKYIKLYDESDFSYIDLVSNDNRSVINEIVKRSKKKSGVKKKIDRLNNHFIGFYNRFLTSSPLSKILFFLQSSNASVIHGIKRLFEIFVLTTMTARFGLSNFIFSNSLSESAISKSEPLKSRLVISLAGLM